MAIVSASTRILPRVIALALVGAAALFAGTSTHAADAKSGSTPVVFYEGKLQDAKRKPVGGVYPLSFSLHTRVKGGKALWSESHFVAVDGGRYVVELGRKHPIPPGTKMENIYLAVSITGGGEVLRERLDPKSIQTGDGPTLAPNRPSSTAPQGGNGGGRSVVDYAETAGLAFEAEHAKVADKIGEMTATELTERLNSASKGSVGGTKRYTAAAGGEGGVQYELKCPKGHVVVGIRGGNGIYLDSIQLICSPLE